MSDEEIQALRQLLDAKSGMDEELLNRCADFLHIGKYDEAVRNAFILLEERLRASVNKENMTGTQLANFAFSPSAGPLAKVLGNNEAEREGLRELFSGAFKLFRNPTAHGVVGYDLVEGKSIIGLVNLLLRILAKVGELSPPINFPENLENALLDIEKAIGASATSRLRKFLGRCASFGMKIAEPSKQWIPFKRYALMKYDHWDKPKPHLLTIFYVFTQGKDKLLWFPINQYYKNVIDLDIDDIQKDLKLAGLQIFGKHQDYTADLKTQNSVIFFDQLFGIVAQISKELETRLEKA
jgi:uncharacterized protein (TIGR02391 family)